MNHRDDTKTLELYLEYCKEELKQHHNVMTKEHYETMYMDAYLELRKKNPDRSKEYMKWWCRYDRL
jgi:anaerobic ribonucleoside-triphosphate reductase